MSDELPALHPTYGYGHQPVIEHAAEFWDTRKFAKVFGPRAESLIRQWPELSDHARKALERVDSEHGSKRTVDAEVLAGELYTAYCKAVGGVAVTRDPLPEWAEFRADPAKEKQSNAWVMTAEAAVGLLGV